MAKNLNNFSCSRIMTVSLLMQQNWYSIRRK